MRLRSRENAEDSLRGQGDAGVRRAGSRACERAIPFRTRATKCPLAGLSNPKSACTELIADKYGCKLAAATVPFSARCPRYAATILGVAGSGC